MTHGTYTALSSRAHSQHQTANIGLLHIKNIVLTNLSMSKIIVIEEAIFNLVNIF